jgi:predicted dinucleotide-binding enzyme
LRELDHAIDCDVLVTGDDKAARQAVIDLIAAMGLKAWHAGPLDNAVVAESLTSILIFINKNHGIDGAGIRISGEPAAS